MRSSTRLPPEPNTTEGPGRSEEERGENGEGEELTELVIAGGAEQNLVGVVGRVLDHLLDGDTEEVGLGGDADDVLANALERLADGNAGVEIEDDTTDLKR